jgi:alkylated DNA nucleotide flippase Atl1
MARTKTTSRLVYFKEENISSIAEAHAQRALVTLQTNHAILLTMLSPDSPRMPLLLPKENILYASLFLTAGDMAACASASFGFLVTLSGKPFADRVIGNIMHNTDSKVELSWLSSSSLVSAPGLVNGEGAFAAHDLSADRCLGLFEGDLVSAPDDDEEGDDFRAVRINKSQAIMPRDDETLPIHLSNHSCNADAQMLRVRFTSNLEEGDYVTIRGVKGALGELVNEHAATIDTVNNIRAG